ncbi:hypothetical protein BVC71_11305 [Marivivens niveibacter]|uniref:Putative DNA-binding domain-containing protein n=1 Tax=Marivivens niveibacter TaxID=1930667 RepID=A0A251WY47_9RHOB|nr:DNA-binding domain-containing protein [Marivivens niveibacter]OUD09276.1 hypothetical protein BVC71_11305 [Marivivens niveibacter]
MHSEFVTAALNPDQPPVGIPDQSGRFNVYRNNIVVGLIDALATGFPAVQRIVGIPFFRAMAGAFVRIHLPKSPIMMEYGVEFPQFLRRFQPVAHLPYLPDVALIELMQRRAYHAADAQPVTMDQVINLHSLKIQLAPAVHVVRSEYPIVDIWRKNTGAPDQVIGRTAQNALISRPQFDPMVDPISSQQIDMIDPMAAGKPLGVLMAGDATDLPDLLRLLISRNAITGLSHDHI